MRLRELFFLTIGITSCGLYARNFYYMMTMDGILLIEPDKTIASIEFLVAVIGTIGLSWMLISYIRRVGYGKTDMEGM
jgi:hypothetical protein